MTQEDKKLLLKDLCARLPYGVMCNIGLLFPLQLQRIFVDRLDGILLDFYEDGDDYQVYLSEVKPYLRPMSSMTDEEVEELFGIIHKKHKLIKYEKTEDRIRFNSTDENGVFGRFVFFYDIESKFISIELLDWLNAHYFDYRKLIEKGLAIEVTEENNPYKE